MPPKAVSCSLSTFVTLSKSLGLILLYFTFSISLTFYNKKVVTTYHLPLIFTLVHLVVKFLAASSLRSIVECCKKEDRVVLQWSIYVKQIALTGITAALDIGLSNWSLSYITISIYTMTKSTSLVFILIFGLIFRVETFKWLQLVVVVCISLGLVLFTYESTEFVLQGFLMCLTASFCAGVRWSLAQLVTQKQELGLHNPIDMMYHVQPWMIAMLLPIALALEGSKCAASERFMRFTDPSLVTENTAIMMGGAVLAFFLEFSEFLLVSHTSSLTMAVSSVAKELCMLLLAEEVYGDRMTAINAVGLVVCLIGIMVHVVLKVRAANDTHGQDKGRSSDNNVSSASAPLLSSKGSHDTSDSEDEIYTLHTLH